MSKVIAHPRRLGFVAFNLVTLGLVVAWLVFRSQSLDDGLAGFPNVVLTTAGIFVLAGIWLGCWIAWSVMVWNRHRRH